tara:strand:+ start:1082 stop:1351 length:270 start_codon:yes stop_codon:yes gene_type:complete
MANYTQSSATTQVKVGAGKLYGVFVSASSSGTLTIYDSGASSTGDPKIVDTFTVAASTTYLNIPAGLFFNKGLYIVLAGTSASFTVAYE